MLHTAPLCKRSIAASTKVIKGQQNFHTSTRMSSTSTSSLLYATVSSSSQATGRVPEHTKELRHHNKSGKGFINPWDSYVDRGVAQIGKALIWYITPFTHSLDSPDNHVGESFSASRTAPILLHQPYQCENQTFSPLVRPRRYEQHGWDTPVIMSSFRADCAFYLTPSLNQDARLSVSWDPNDTPTNPAMLPIYRS